MDNSVQQWKIAIVKWEEDIKQYYEADALGGAFICVEPPPKPKLEDYV